ncbi:DEKNAAC102059 [Brettanomyces naardenensis]|uniref:DNA repair protein REV1 n=1 Tax=Brettanomyces naardenensis TaxID=13370 RepID=A0A448YJT9_BRENA|nr:DEKNAAC102059 [Brettanomyces naardenensis]
MVLTSSSAQDWSIDDSEVGRLLNSLSGRKGGEEVKEEAREGVRGEPSEEDKEEAHEEDYSSTDVDESVIAGSQIEVPSSQVDVPSSQIEDSPPIKTASQAAPGTSFFKTSGATDEWGSMNNSEFIAFVNRLGSTNSQFKKPQSSYMATQKDIQPPSPEELTDDDEAEVPKPPTSMLTTSSFGFNTSDERDIFNQLEKERGKGSEGDNSLDNHQDSQAAAKNADPDILATSTANPTTPFPVATLPPPSLPPMDVGSQELEFGDYETYFRNKQLKQQNQDEEYVDFVSKARNVSYPKIFKDCVIYVNGKTHPDISQLHKMIILHGGRFLAYLGAKGNATHIIAENLTPRKRIEFRNYKVVKPEWIVQSIEAGKILPWGDFMLINMDYGQKKLEFRRAAESKEVEVSKAEAKQVEDDNAPPLSPPSQLSQFTDPEEPLETSPEDEVADDYGHLTAKDPLFLDKFFAKSRLHHLSSWKMDLRSKFLQRAVETLRARRSEKPKTTQQKVVIHVDFDCFFATVSALKHDPPLDINKYPLCVTHGSSGSDVASCNYVARSKGCKNGMWLGQARKLCPNLICLPYNFDAYENISQQFYGILLSLDLDSILPVSVDEALLDVTSLCETEEPIAIMTSIRSNVFEKTGCSVSCGCGSNVLLAKLALRRAKPDGIYTVDDADILSFTANLKFRDLPGIGYSINAKLEKELHVKNMAIDRLRELSQSKLISLFGVKTGTTIYEYARGIDHTSIDILEDPEKFTRKSLSIDVNWGIRFDDDLQVEDFLSRLSQVMVKRLIETGMVGSSLTLKLAMRHPDAPIEPAKFLGMGDCLFVSKSSKFGISTREAGMISSELKYLWRILGEDAKELRGVSITMNKLVQEGKKEDINQLKLPWKADKQVQGKEENNSPIIKRLRVSPKKVPAVHLPASSPQLVPQPVPQPPPLLERDQINWDVFKELPMEIQLEIKQELRRRELQSTPRKRRIINRQQNDIGIMLESPTKRRILNREVTITEKLIDSRARLRFQGIPITKFDTIKEKLLEWMDCTIDDSNGPLEVDIEMFNDLMLKLLDVGELLKYLDILNMMEIRLDVRKDRQGYDKWHRIMDQLKDIFGELSSKDIEFLF